MSYQIEEAQKVLEEMQKRAQEFQSGRVEYSNSRPFSKVKLILAAVAVVVAVALVLLESGFRLGDAKNGKTVIPAGQNIPPTF